MRTLKLGLEYFWMLARRPRFASTTSKHSGSQNMSSCSSTLSSPSSLGCAWMAKYSLPGARICPCPRAYDDQAGPPASVILDCWCNNIIGEQLVLVQNIYIYVFSPINDHMTVICCCRGNTNVQQHEQKPVTLRVTVNSEVGRPIIIRPLHPPF